MLVHPIIPPAAASGETRLNPNANVFHSTSSSASVELVSPSATHWSDPSLSDLSVTNITAGSVAVNGLNLTGSGVVQMAVVYPSSTSVSASHYPSQINGIHLPAASVMYTTGVDSPSANAVDENAVMEDYLAPEQLRTMLKTQLEYYFSRENLAHDTYLVSQMDADQFVPITTVASFNQIKRLTHKIDLIVDVLKESSFVQVDENGEKVRPLHKRCIVILREVPESTPVEEIENLFSGQTCPKFISCQFAHNNSWYVTFDSEEEAQRAYRYLREEVRTLRGVPIMARIKAKPLLGVGAGVNKDMVKSHYGSAVYGHAKFTYTSPVPSIQYIAPQHLPFFLPHANVSPMWSTSIAYFDPGMAFAANGYIPTAAYVPPSSTAPNASVSSHRIRTSSGQNGRRLDHGDTTGSNSGNWNATAENRGCPGDEAAGPVSDRPRRTPRNGPIHSPTTPTAPADARRGHNAAARSSAGEYRGATGRNGSGLRFSYSTSDGPVMAQNRRENHDDVDAAGSSVGAARDRVFASGRNVGNRSGRRKGRNGVSDGAKAPKDVDSVPAVFELEDKYFPPLPGALIPLDQQKSNDSSDRNTFDDVTHKQSSFKADQLSASAKSNSLRVSIMGIKTPPTGNLSTTKATSSTDSAVETESLTAAKLSYAQMALRGKERHLEHKGYCSSPGSPLFDITSSPGSPSSTLREQLTPVRSKKPMPSYGIAAGGPISRRAFKEKENLSENNEDCSTRNPAVPPPSRCSVDERK